MPKCDQIDKLNLQQCLIDSPHADKIPHFLAQAHQMLGGETVKRLSQE
jgi:predicted aldo/keto reductase-like oxidoreductase